MITSVIRFGGKKTKKKKRPSWRDFNGHRRLRRVGIIYYNMYIYLSIIGIYIEYIMVTAMQARRRSRRRVSSWPGAHVDSLCEPVGF